jgi:hypothetical protein
MIRGYGDLFEEPDEELKKRMSESDYRDEVYKACFDIMLLRRHERLIDKTGDLVRKTRWLTIATWAVAGAAIITVLIQLFVCR